MYLKIISISSALVVLLSRTDPAFAASSVRFAAASSTIAENAEEHYTAVAGTLHFAAGQTNQTLRISMQNDPLREPTETSVTGIEVEFAQYWAEEGTGFVVVGVVRGLEEETAATVDYTTVMGTATPETDYTNTSGTLHFAAGEKLKFITIPILNDGVKEPDETFTLKLSSAAGVVLGTRSTATITILDNDPGIQFTANQLWVQETEAAVQLTVTRGNDGRLDAFTVDYTTTNGTAIAGSDYAETKGTLAFAAGEMTKSFVVPILNDAVAEKDEKFKVVLSNPTGGMVMGTATNTTATVTVCDVTEMVPHRFDVVQVSPAGVVSLTLGGGFSAGLGLSNRFQPYFDIYPVEVSTNLVDWTPLTWMVRTNASTNLLTFIDTNVHDFVQRFYRTPATTFVASQRVPSGPYPVGVTDRTIKDDTRRNRYRISTNSSFPISIWYPAARRPGQWPTARDSEPFARDSRALQGVIDRAPYLRSYSVRNAPFAAGLAGLPVVFWSHGNPVYRNDGQEWAEHLASHGYVVVGVDHFDSSFVVYPDGTYLYTDSNRTGGDRSVELVEGRVRDLVVVLDEMARWNQNDDLFAGRLDVQNTAAMGWSYGGGVAAEFCRVDPRGKAAIVLEGYFQNADALLAAGLSKPVLSIYADPINVPGSELLLFNKLNQDAVWFQIRDTEHWNFSTWYWWFTSRRLDHSREAARTITDYTLWFLNKYLKGNTDPMPPSASYPQVFNLKQK